MDVMTSRGGTTGRRTSLLMWALLSFVVGGFLMYSHIQREERRKAEEAERGNAGSY